MAILERLIEALRNELQQYGEMLALLDHQYAMGQSRGADDILNSISDINAQSAIIEAARQSREEVQRKLAESFREPGTATFAQLLPLLPGHYRGLVSALVQENNQLLSRVRQRAEENQRVLHRSLEMMQQFITNLAPDQRPAPGSDETELLASPIDSPLYETIV